MYSSQPLIMLMSTASLPLLLQLQHLSIFGSLLFSFTPFSKNLSLHCLRSRP